MESWLHLSAFSQKDGRRRGGEWMKQDWQEEEKEGERKGKVRREEGAAVLKWDSAPRCVSQRGSVGGCFPSVAVTAYN